MIEKILKAVKSNNKKKGRSITIGTVIGFILSCSAVMGADVIRLDITQNLGEEINFNGLKYNKATHLFGYNTFENNIYTNNMIINEEDDSGNNSENNYAIRLSLSDTPISIVNNGKISNFFDNDGGITITNFGLKNLGIIEDIENKGQIVGLIPRLSNGGGYGINNDKIIENVMNSGKIAGRGNGLGHGYGIYNTGTITNINNLGVISSDATTTTTANAINNDGGTISNLNNYGIFQTSGDSAISKNPIVENNYGLYITKTTSVKAEKKNIQMKK